MNHSILNSGNLFQQVTSMTNQRVNDIVSGKVELKMYTFKPNMLTSDPDEMQTVIADSLGAAIQKNPEMIKWYLHSITK